MSALAAVTPAVVEVAADDWVDECAVGSWVEVVAADNWGTTLWGITPPIGDTLTVGDGFIIW
ncbi:hypothetical protein SEA_LENNON_40 [Gordonia phage Lennon]|uniref:Uncharacterized protein n=14 Tax=Vividuovirus TaxID=2560251 RepID=A0A2U9PFX5_9CAUD|nr:hypothetical protein BJD57_gp42 [Gordonia phage Vivi2]YP_009615790.1 hypothetical protein FDI74_gp40 [Gordonia phage Lennon]YP_009622990.1 hypothetical protein FDJ33_gp41 [Gordonia phage Brandonk123]YP_010096832.1 hypothetical protein KNT97_gp40 [Gordonia phage Rofo]YP_010097931.1 hypothetical protein KNU06_gp38 [Gordonia phage Angelicage]YP_010099281.1 hypothetical protein KNU19_gp38 [Gordonia phage Fosterous]YP_010099449.1 hypothetical protein KNU21_gp34 [Gordonia phage Nordenberg]YP_01